MQLVKTVEQATKNILRFEKATEKSDVLCDRLSNFRAWFGTRDDKGDLVLAPSKFIGYHNITAADYDDLSTDKDGIDGRETQRHLVGQGWFVRLTQHTSMKPSDVLPILTRQLEPWGKLPSKLSRFYLLPEEVEAARSPQDRLFDVIMEATSIFTPQQKATLRQHLRS